MSKNQQPEDWGTCMFYLFLAVCGVFILLACYRAIQRRYFDYLARQNPRRQLPTENRFHETPSQLRSVGLASAVIHSLPAIQLKGSDAMDCAVCLGEFGEGEWVRLLPNCAHLFHVSCIDVWFREHSTCPLCRMDVLFDFSSCGSSVSVVALLATLRREDTCQERPLSHCHLDSAAMQNPEHGVGDAREFVCTVSPILESNRRVATENPPEQAQKNCYGESSGADRNVQAMSTSPESSPSSDGS